MSWNLGIDGVLEPLRKAIEGLRRRRTGPPLAGVGAAVPGQWDRERGISIQYPRIPEWKNVPLRRIYPLGDSREIVGDAGLIVPSGDAGAFASAWQRLLDAGTEARRVLGQRGRGRVLERYSVKAMAEAYLHTVWRGESMINHEDLTRPASHFAFGRNWAEYAAKITEAEIREAEAGLERLLGGERLDGKRFLDIGSGSGLHSLAALRLGAREVVAVDIDADSVATTHAVLSRFVPQGPWQCQEKSVFDLNPEERGDFDVVYSWGVLHHTGDLDRALDCAARMVSLGGLFLLAIYRRIWMDPFWRWEKRWYAQASPTAQAWARKIYIGLFRLGLLVTGRRFGDYVGNYRRRRGMDYYHDVHDWMGGWPYESRKPEEVLAKMRALGFAPVRVFARRGRLLGRDAGVFGSGCDEFVFRKSGQVLSFLPIDPTV